MRYGFTFLLLIGISLNGSAQNDSAQIRRIFTTALTQGDSYENLRQLTRIPARISGSDQAAKAVKWAEQRMKDLGFDTVYLQECMVPHWIRGEKEEAAIILNGKRTTAPVCALGGSIGTGSKGIEAQVVEVKNFQELKTLGEANIKGKIVFYNRPFDDSDIYPFTSYGKAVDQRWAGASEAVKYGAVGVVVRSMSHLRDDNPHTGAMEYADPSKKIPAVAISTNGADLLSSLLTKDKSTRFYFRTTCNTLPDVVSYNVIGELRGIKNKNEVILVGGHLDSWDNGEGAHDDGAGCVQAIEVLNIFKKAGIRPDHTIRAVMFMNEESMGRGADRYRDEVLKKREKHLAAIESDAGGFSPRGFAMEGTDAQRKTISSWRPLFEPYGVYDFSRKGAGADVEPLVKMGILGMELIPDGQRYFDYHHAATDVFANINKRELELGAAAMAALVYMIDRHPLEQKP